MLSDIKKDPKNIELLRTLEDISRQVKQEQEVKDKINQMEEELERGFEQAILSDIDFD